MKDSLDWPKGAVETSPWIGPSAQLSTTTIFLGIYVVFVIPLYVVVFYSSDHLLSEALYCLNVLLFL